MVIRYQSFTIFRGNSFSHSYLCSYWLNTTLHWRHWV